MKSAYRNANFKMKRISFIGGFLVAAGMLSPGVTTGQDYPTKPIRIVTAEPGGNTDLVTRLIAEALHLGQPVITYNRPTGIVAAETVLSSPPDGYTLLLQSSGFWVGPLVQKMSYDSVRDFTPVTLATNAPFFLYVHPALPAKNVRELIALAKAKPGALNYGSSTAGASNHLSAELFKSMTGVNLTRIGYKGAGAAGIALMSNEVQLAFGSGSFGMPHVKAGRLRVLGVADDERSALAPDVPTISESGVPDYEAAGMSGIWVRARTPKNIIARLNTEVIRALGNRDLKDKLLSVGIVTVGSSVEKAAAYIKSDIVKWTKVIKDAGMGEK